MIIRKIDVEHFGTLAERQYEFTDGLNTVSGLSGEEGSALQAFIGAMLYGLSDEENETWQPEDAGALYGGRLTVTSGNADFLITRNFKKDEEALKVTRLSDNAAAVYPDLWIAEAAGHISKEAFIQNGLIQKDAFFRERLELSGDEETIRQIRREKELRDRYEDVKKKFTEECSELDEKIDWEARSTYDRSLNEIKALKERQLQIRQECPVKEKALETLKQEVDLRLAETDDVETALQEEEKKQEEAFEAFAAHTKKRALTGSKLGSFLMFLGLLLFVCTWFYTVSVLNQHVSGQNALYVNIAVGASAALFLSGLVSAIVSGVKVKKASHIEEDDTEEKRTLDGAKLALADYRTKKKEELEALRNDPERNARIASDEQELSDMKQEIREGTAYYSELYQKIEALRDQIRTQAPFEHSYKALACANETFDKLIAGVKEKTRALLETEDEPLTEKAWQAFLSRMDEADPSKKLPVVSGDILSGLTEEQSESVARECLSNAGRQVILLKS